MDNEQLRVDLMYLAHRQKALEDAISEWTEFMTVELLRQGVTLHKHKRSYAFFKRSLSETHKRNFEEQESISLKIKQLFNKVGRTPKDTYVISK